MYLVYLNCVDMKIFYGLYFIWRLYILIGFKIVIYYIKDIY